MATALELELQEGDIVRRGGRDMKVWYLNVGTDDRPSYIGVCEFLGHLPFVGPKLEIIEVYSPGKVRARFLDKYELERVEFHRPNGDIIEEFEYISSPRGLETDIIPEYAGLSLVERAQVH